MSNDMIPASMMKGGAVSSIFKGQIDTSLGEGIKSGFGVIGYRGKVWSTKFQGNEVPLMREDGDGARASIDVVIVQAAPHIAKIFYEAGYEPGSTAPPDCWSTNGVVPDSGASKKQAATCAGCPKNAWGSKVTEAGKQTKACGDNKRLAVVPLNDLRNEAMGGPMLLRAPAASLKDLKAYADLLNQHGFPYFAVATKISFDVKESFPKFVFAATRPLTDDEARVVAEFRDGPLVNNILNTSVEIVHHEPDAPTVPASPFTQTQTPAAQPAAVQAQPVQPAAQASATAAQPAAATPAGEPQKRTRRTKAEMEAAAQALKDKRNGVAAPAGAAPAQPAQPAQAQPMASSEALAAASSDDEPSADELDSLVEGLLP